jgi:hypothetical protein
MQFPHPITAHDVDRQGKPPRHQEAMTYIAFCSLVRSDDVSFALGYKLECSEYSYHV